MLTEKLLFMYFLTNQNINQIGLYEIRNERVVFDTGCNVNELINFQRKVSKIKKIIFHQGYVYIVNIHKYQYYKGRKNDLAKIKEYKLVNKDIFDTFNSLSDNKLSIDYQYYIDKTENKKSEINIQKLEIQNNKPVIEASIEGTRKYLKEKGIYKH
jgi:hypothetical protein